MDKQKPKYQDAIVSYSNATLGISMVIAILFGIAIGYGLEKLFEVRWLFWLGVFWGVSAAILNVYKVYKRQMRDMDELAKDPKYASKKPLPDDED